MDLVVVGTMAFDSIESPFGKSEKIVGGAATYLSLAASYFTRTSGVVSVIGGDFPGPFMEGMKDRNINLEGVQVRENEKSFFWSGRYHYDMNTRDTLDTQLNVILDFEPDLPAAYRASDFLMLGNLDPKIQMKVLDQMDEKPQLVVLDTMNFWMDNSMEDLKKVLHKIDVLTINDEEARQLSNEYSLVKAARKISEMGPRIMVIKKGEHGALLFKDNEIFFAPALPIEEVKDPTGAGDTFAGGFLGYIAQTKDISFDNLKRAVIAGSAMASFTVEEFGTERLLNLTENEIDDRMQLFVDLVNFDMVFMQD